MKKILAMVCVLAALGALGTRLYFGFFTMSQPTADKDGFITRTETSYDPSGREVKKTETKLKLVRVNRLMVNEGAELLATADGLELKNSPGQLYYEEPLIGQTETATWWLLFGTSLAAGLYLWRKKM